MKRQLATIRRISKISNIKNADRIVIGYIDGWQTIISKQEFNVGDDGSFHDLCLFIEPGAWVPYDIAPFLCNKDKPKTYKNVVGARIKSIRLRGEFSQGLAIAVQQKFNKIYLNGVKIADKIDDCVDEILNIKQYYPQNTTKKSGAKGTMNLAFPHYYPKTDQDRVQNKTKYLNQEDDYYEVSLKLEGSSGTYSYYDKDELNKIAVCSRTIRLRTPDEVSKMLKINHYNNTKKKIVVELKKLIHHPIQSLRNITNLYKTRNLPDSAISTMKRTLNDIAFEIDERYKISSKLKELGKNIAIRGEFMGPDISGKFKNYENFDHHKYFIYDVYDIDKQEYLLPRQRYEILKKLGLMELHVPILNERYKVPVDVAEALEIASGKSINNKIREGVVFKHCDKIAINFKAINPDFEILESKTD